MLLPVCMIAAARARSVDARRRGRRQVPKSLISSLTRAQIRISCAQDSLGEDRRVPANPLKKPNGCFRRRTRQARKTGKASNAPSVLTPRAIVLEEL